MKIKCKSSKPSYRGGGDLVATFKLICVYVVLPVFSGVFLNTMFVAFLSLGVFLGVRVYDPALPYSLHTDAVGASSLEVFHSSQGESSWNDMKKQLFLNVRLELHCTS